MFCASNIWQLVVVVVVLCVGKMRKMKCKYLRCVLYFIVFYLNIYSTLEGIYSIEISVVVVVVALFFTLSFCLCFLVLFAFVLQCCTAQLSLIIVGVSHWGVAEKGEAICNYVPLFTLRPAAKCPVGSPGRGSG